jgi:glyoxylase-like metal-dependent hydrolase (beta-lactamase superfamily II)
MLTPGHSPGGQSVLVDTSAGKALITGFCCNAENFPKGGGVICPGVHLDAVQAYESARRAREAADILIPLHDLSVGAKKTIPYTDVTPRGRVLAGTRMEPKRGRLNGAT